MEMLHYLTLKINDTESYDAVHEDLLITTNTQFIFCELCKKFGLTMS